MPCAKMPSEGENAGADKQRKMGEKLQKLSFLKLEIMRKMDIFRQI